MKETRDLPIFCYSGLAFTFAFVSLLLCVPKSLKLASFRQNLECGPAGRVLFCPFFFFWLSEGNINK